MLAAVKNHGADLEYASKNLRADKEVVLAAVKNASKIKFLEKEKAQLMRDMEQEAEPEGGPIANEYGRKLNRIDNAIAKLRKS